jgi:hypothetical protein
MFGKVLDVTVKEVAEGGQNGVMGIVVVGKQPDALFDLGKLLFEIIDMGPLDIVNDDLYGKGFEIMCTKNPSLQTPEAGWNYKPICSPGRDGSDTYRCITWG